MNDKQALETAVLSALSAFDNGQVTSSACYKCSNHSSRLISSGLISSETLVFTVNMNDKQATEIVLLSTVGTDR